MSAQIFSFLLCALSALVLFAMSWLLVKRGLASGWTFGLNARPLPDVSTLVTGELDRLVARQRKETADIQRMFWASVAMGAFLLLVLAEGALRADPHSAAWALAPVGLVALLLWLPRMVAANNYRRAQVRRLKALEQLQRGD